MANILLTAENFAFGPISKLLFIAELLKKENHKLIFAGFGTSYSLAKTFPFDEIHELDTDNKDELSRLEEIINSSDMLISSMDRNSVSIAKKLNKKVVWVDCLFWFWESLPDDVLDVDLYIAENSIHKNGNEEMFKKRITNFLDVGPIVGEMNKVKKENQIIISYGGGEAAYWYKVGKDTNYPYFMTEIFEKYVDLEEFDKVIIATNEKIISSLKEQFKHTRFEFAQLPQEKFIEEVAKSQLLLTTAGLVTTQTAFELETPIVFILPTNNAHYLLMDELESKGLVPASIHLSDFLPKLEMRGKEEEENLPEVLSQLRKIDESDDKKKLVGEKITEYIKSRNQWGPKSVDDNKKFMGTLGKNGLDVAFEAIKQLLNKK